MDSTLLLQLGAGLAILTLGAEGLVRGASRLAARAGISSLVIGLTVVAYGTSAPEFAVSMKGALGGQSDIALGNVVGSNIFNVLFILGACALILPLRVDSQLVRLDVPIMIGVSLLLLLLARDGEIGRLDGSLLTGGIIAYTSFSLWKSRSESRAVQEEFDRAFATPPAPAGGMAWNLAMLAGGLVLLVTGARIFVTGAITAAEALGVSQLVIGLTIVAAGTSLPEVATSIVATIRGERDIAIGNVVGSNIFNILGVIGGAALASPMAVAPVALRVDAPVMIGVALISLPVFFTGLCIRRWEGALFLALYIAYTAWLILSAGASPWLPAYKAAMLYGALPATALLLAGATTRALWVRRRDPA